MSSTLNIYLKQNSEPEVFTIANTKRVGAFQRYSCSLEHCWPRLFLFLITVSCPSNLSEDDDDNDEVLFMNKLAVIYMQCFR